MLSVVGLDINFYHDADGLEPIVNNTVHVGDDFFVEISVQDLTIPLSADPGVRELFLDLAWEETGVLEGLDASNDPNLPGFPALNDKLTPHWNWNAFEDGYYGSMHGYTVNSNDPLGASASEWFTRLHFEAIAQPASGSLTFDLTVDNYATTLDGVVFQDGSWLDAVGGVVVDSPAITILPALQEPVITVGDHVLYPDMAGQEIEIYVTGGQEVAGLNLYLEMGDGGPTIEDLNILNGTIFADNNNGQFGVENPDLTPRDEWRTTTTTIALGPIAADGLLATVTIDTTGLTSGTWSLTLGTGTSFPIGGSEQVGVLVNGSIQIGDPPVAEDHEVGVDEGGTATTTTLGASSVLVNNGPGTTATLISGPTHYDDFVLNPDGTFSYTHNDSEVLTDSFTYRATDGNGLNSADATVTITVAPVNDNWPIAPIDNSMTAVEDGDSVITLDSGEWSLLAFVTDLDLPNDQLTLITTPINGPVNGVLELNYAGNGSFVYTHDGSDTTTDSFTYEVRDAAGHSDTATVTITITGLNDNWPMPLSDTMSVSEGGTQTQLDTLSNNLLANDEDADPGDSLRLGTAPVDGFGPTHGSVILHPNGEFEYTHDGSENFTDSFVYTVFDDADHSATATVHITIDHVNDNDPVANDDWITVAVSGTATVLDSAELNLQANDTDADLEAGPNDLLHVVATAGFVPTEHGSVMINADGTFVYTHDGSDTTTDSFTYTVMDDADHTDQATVHITVTPADIQIEVRLYEDNNGTPGNQISEVDGVANIAKGQLFFVEILVGDLRAGGLGITQLSVDFGWSDLVFDLNPVASPFDPVNVITDKLSLQQDGTLDPNFGAGEEGIRNLSGAGSEPIGDEGLERFAIMRFEAIDFFEDAPLPWSLSIGADGVTLESGETEVDANIEEQTVVPEIATPDISIEMGYSTELEGPFDDADAEPGPLFALNEVLIGRYAVTNSGNVGLWNVVITDDRGTPGNPSDDLTIQYEDIAEGDLDADQVLDVGETWVFFEPVTAREGQLQVLSNVVATPVFGPGSAEATDPTHYFGVIGAIGVETSTNGEANDDVPTGPLVPTDDPISFTYEVTNWGNVALADIVLTDDNGTPGDTSDDFEPTFVGGDGNGNGLLDLGETWNYEASAVALVGQFASLVTATANPVLDDGTDIEDVLDASGADASHYLGVGPGVEIDVLTNGVDDLTLPAGNPITWTYRVTNPGNVILGDVTVTDDNGTPGDTADDIVLTLVSGDADSDGLLDTNEMWMYEADGIAGSGPFTNIATVTANPVDENGLDIPELSDVGDTDASDHFGQFADIQLENATNGQDADAPTGPIILVGDAVTWTFVLTNQGNVALGSVTMTDDQGVTFLPPDGDIDGDGLLDVDETWTYTVTGVATAGQYANLGSVTADPVDEGGTPIIGLAGVNDSDPSHYVGMNVGINVEKSTNGDDADDPTGPYIPVAGQVNVTWIYTVTNTGDVTLADIVLTDDAQLTLIGNGNGDQWLSPGETWTYEAFGVALPDQQVDAVDVTANPVDAAGLDIPGLADATDSDASHYFGAVAGIEISTTTNGQDGPFIPVDNPVTWTYTVSNTGNVAIGDLAVTDDQGVTLDPPGGDDNANGLLDVGETWIYQATGTAAAGAYTNLGLAQGNPIEPDGSDIDGMVNVTDNDPSDYFGIDAGIQILAKVNGEDADDPTGPLLEAGASATFDYIVTNLGNVALSDIIVTDDNGTPSLPSDDFQLTLASGDTNSDGLLDVDETWNYSHQRTVAAGPFSGMATVTALDSTQAAATDANAAHFFGVVTGIDVEVTVNGQEYDTPSGLIIAPGETVTFDYSLINTGNMPLTDVVLVDDNGTPGDAADDFEPTFVDGDTNGDGVLDTDETWTYLHTATVADGQFSGSTTATGVDVRQETQTDDDAAHFFGIDAAIEIVAAVDGDDADTPDGPLVDADASSTFTYEVTNSGNTPLGDIVITDSQGVDPQLVDGDDNDNGQLDPGETWIYEVIAAPLAGQTEAIAEVSATPLDAGVPIPGIDEITAENSTHYFGVETEIDVEVTIDDEDADSPLGVIVEPGDTVTLEYEVENLGNVPLADVELIDDNGTPNDTSDDFEPTFASGDTNGDGLLDTNETWRYTHQRIAGAGQFAGTTTVTAEDTMQIETTDSDAAHFFGGLSSISGSVFVDDDNDGFFDAGEYGLPGVTIMLTGTDTTGAAVARMTQTNAQGLYSFVDLPSGTYEVSELQPAAFRDGKDSNPLQLPPPKSDRFEEVILSGGDDLTNFDFGEQGLLEVSARLFLSSTPPAAELYRQAVDWTPPLEGILSNPAEVVQNGSQLTVTGTNGNDLFEFIAGATQHRLVVNGVVHQVDATQVTNILFDGGAGQDTARLTGTDGNDTVVLQPSGGRLTGSGYVIDLAHTESILADGRGGQDQAMMFDSPGDDQLRADGKFAWMFGKNFANWVFDFEQVQAISQSGGNDKSDVESAVDFLLQLDGNW